MNEKKNKPDAAALRDAKRGHKARIGYTALAPVPIAAFGSSETAATGKAFLKGYVGVCLEGAVIVLSCLIFSAYMGSGSPAVPSGSAVSMVWTYVAEMIFNMMVLVGLVKGSDRIVREMMSL